MRSLSNWHWLLRFTFLHLKKLALKFTISNGVSYGSIQSRREEDEKGKERERGGGNKKKIKPMNELHAHYGTKKPFEALSVRSSFMVKQEKASSLKR